MSMVQRLIDQLEQRKLSIKAGGKPGLLLLCGPDAEKTPDVLDALKKFKPQLLKIYAPEPEPVVEESAPRESEAAAPVAGPELEKCPLCIRPANPALCPAYRPLETAQLTAAGECTRVEAPPCPYHPRAA